LFRKATRSEIYRVMDPRLCLVTQRYLMPYLNRNPPRGN